MSHDSVTLSVKETSATHPGFDDPDRVVEGVVSLLPPSDPGAVDNVVVAELVGVSRLEAVVVNEGATFHAIRIINLMPVFVDLGFGQDVVRLSEDGLASLEIKVESSAFLPRSGNDPMGLRRVPW